MMKDDCGSDPMISLCMHMAKGVIICFFEMLSSLFSCIRFKKHVGDIFLVVVILKRWRSTKDSWIYVLINKQILFFLVFIV